LVYRIRGGRFVDTAPFMAAIYYGTDFLCGGTLIHNREERIFKLINVY